jgi:hypothetical protein
VGSGAGGDDDCPHGFGCITTFGIEADGTRLCVPAERAVSLDGYPFGALPAETCTDVGGCQTGACAAGVCEPACLANRDCPGDAICSADDRCHAPQAALLDTGEVCLDHTECDSGVCQGVCEASGALCDDDFECLGLGPCVRRCIDRCRSNDDCDLAVDTCTPWPLGYSIFLPSVAYVPSCVPRYGTGTDPDGSFCATYETCASDWCIEGTCTTMCGSDSDCAGLPGTYCRPKFYQDSNGNPTYAASFCLP